MKVSVNLTIDVDPQAWEAVGYGIDESVRADVREYIYHSVQGLPGIEDSGADVTLRT